MLCHASLKNNKHLRSYPASEVRGGDKRTYPTSEARGGGWEDHTHTQ